MFFRRFRSNAPAEETHCFSLGAAARVYAKGGDILAFVYWQPETPGIDPAGAPMVAPAGFYWVPPVRPIEHYELIATEDPPGNEDWERAAAALSDAMAATEGHAHA
jgi:hypothetical protein